MNRLWTDMLKIACNKSTTLKIDNGNFSNLSEVCAKFFQNFCPAQISSSLFRKSFPNFSCFFFFSKFPLECIKIPATSCLTFSTISLKFFENISLSQFLFRSYFCIFATGNFTNPRKLVLGIYFEYEKRKKVFPRTKHPIGAVYLGYVFVSARAGKYDTRKLHFQENTVQENYILSRIRGLFFQVLGYF